MKAARRKKEWEWGKGRGWLLRSLFAKGPRVCPSKENEEGTEE